MRIKFHRIEKNEKKIFRSNRQIKADEVFLIDENGQGLGIFSLEEALEKAKEVDLDLVEINPKANPPAVKIVDLGHLKYEHEKRIHKQKMMQKKIDTKVLRLSLRISEHDFNFRLNQAEKFLKKENKLKLELILRGRERQYIDKAKEIVGRFVKLLQKNKEINLEIEQDLTIQGGRLIILLVNKK